MAHEAFADRRYLSTGELASRSVAGAVIERVDDAVDQARSVALGTGVDSLDGVHLPLEADTLCVHGDGAHAADFARSLREALNAAGVEVRSLV